MYHASRGILSRMFDKYGLMKRTQSENARKHSINECFFESINSEKSAYWLGFLYADGYVSSNGNRIALGLCNKDYDHLQKFLNDIEADYTIEERVVGKRKNGLDDIICRVSISSVKMH